MRLAAVAAVVAVFTSACGLFTTKEPYERWNIAITYNEEGPNVVARPEQVEVNGPSGEIRVNNSTEVERGFKIDDLGVAATIGEETSVRLQVVGVEDGESYTYLDHLNDDGPRGRIVVRYIRRD